MNRKKLGGCLLAMLAALQWAPARAQQSHLALVEGTITRTRATTAYLYSVSEGNLTEIAQQRIAPNGRFAFAVPDPAEGFYYLGTNVYPKMEVTRLYLKPGDQLTLQVGDSTTAISGGSPEEKTLNDWQQLSAEVMRIGIQFWTDHFGYVKFFPALQRLLPQAE
ncbi:MAG TPA: hypothetical protein VGC22_08555, partial [Chitinophaga sp.]